MEESTQAPRSQLTWTGRLAIAGASSVLLLGVALYSTIQFGVVSGEEFSPTTFQRRLFIYYEIPFARLLVSPIEHTDTTGALEQLLRSKKLLSAEEAADRWDLVVGRRGLRLAAHGDALILRRYLAATGPQEKLVWLEWTKANTEAGEYFWPIIAKLARQELYFFMPDLFTAAVEFDFSDPHDLQAFQTRVRRELADDYTALGRTQHELGRHGEAIELLSEALSYWPKDRDALRWRAACYAEMGETQKAKKDQKAMKQLAEDE